MLPGGRPTSLVLSINYLKFINSIFSVNIKYVQSNSTTLRYYIVHIKTLYFSNFVLIPTINSIILFNNILRNCRMNFV